MMVYKDYKDLLKTTLLELSPLMLEEKEIYKLGTLRKIWDCYTDIQKRLTNMFAYLVLAVSPRIDPSSSRTQASKTWTRLRSTSPTLLSS